MKKKITWIIVADGARARVLTKSNGNTGYEDVEGVDFVADMRPTHEINSDRPGRSFDSKGAGRHAMEPPSDAHREEKRQLANRVGDFLEEKRLDKAYDRLVIIAAPRTLGDLRDAMPGAVRDLVVEEIDKDITKLAPTEMDSTLDKMISVVI